MEFVIRSQSEGGYWNNDHGWVGSEVEATRFTQAERSTCYLPITSGADAGWLPAKTH